MVNGNSYPLSTNRPQERTRLGAILMFHCSDSRKCISWGDVSTNVLLTLLSDSQFRCAMLCQPSLAR